MPTHLQQKLGPISAAVAVGMYGTIFLTYSICVKQGHCDSGISHLPSISGTWTHFPETNISRFVVGNVAILMGAIQFAIYWMDVDALSAKWNKILTALAVVGCFGLAGVGAICDSTNPDCRGNGTLHVVTAAIFFIGYNAQMIIRSCLVAKGGCRAEIALAAASVVAKARFAPVVAPGMLGGFPWGNVVEWLDVAIICVWTALYVARRGGGLRLCVLDSAAKGADDPAPLAPWWTMLVCAAMAVALYAGTLATTAVAYHSAGRWPKNGWPFISDMWVYPPGNWISRYGAVAGATLAGFCHLCAYYLRRDGAGRGSGAALTALACAAMLGLEVVGCVDESENLLIHAAGAGVFFAGYDLFMVLTAGELITGRGGAAASVTALAAAVSVACKLRFLPAASAAGPAALGAAVGWGPLDIAAVLEWADATAIIVFFCVYVAAEGAVSSQVGLAVVPAAPVAGEEGDDDEELC